MDDDYLITRDLLSDIEGWEFDLEWVTAIEDDGKGFDVEKRLVSALNEKRMGLHSMEERVSSAWGQNEDPITSDAGHKNPDRSLL